jgi:hypothetical protein
MGQVPQCTGRLYWEIKVFFQISTLVCLSSIYICNLLIDLPSYLHTSLRIKTSVANCTIVKELHNLMTVEVTRDSVRCRNQMKNVRVVVT